MRARMITLPRRSYRHFGEGDAAVDTAVMPITEETSNESGDIDDADSVAVTSNGEYSNLMDSGTEEGDSDLLSMDSGDERPRCRAKVLRPGLYRVRGRGAPEILSDDDDQFDADSLMPVPTTSGALVIAPISAEAHPLLAFFAHMQDSIGLGHAETELGGFLDFLTPVKEALAPALQTGGQALTQQLQQTAGVVGKDILTGNFSNVGQSLSTGLSTAVSEGGSAAGQQFATSLSDKGYVQQQLEAAAASKIGQTVIAAGKKIAANKYYLIGGVAAAGVLVYLLMRKKK